MRQNIWESQHKESSAKKKWMGLFSMTVTFSHNLLPYRDDLQSWQVLSKMISEMCDIYSHFDYILQDTHFH